MKKEHGQAISAMIAVLSGILAIILLIPNIQIAASFLSLTFGIMAVIWTLKASMSLSKGTSLREYSDFFLFALALILTMSIWEMLFLLFEWSEVYLYPKYLLLTLTYLTFAFVAYKMYNLGKQFSFKPQVDKMELAKIKRIAIKKANKKNMEQNSFESKVEPKTEVVRDKESKVKKTAKKKTSKKVLIKKKVAKKTKKKQTQKKKK